jgi:hypothetical protein
MRHKFCKTVKFNWLQNNFNFVKFNLIITSYHFVFSTFYVIHNDDLSSRGNELA